MYSLVANATFDSAHFLAGYCGKCANLHGHTWRIEAEIAEEQVQWKGEKRGMILDFSDFKQTLRQLADSMDHALIYEEDTLQNTTVEALLAEGFRLIAVSFRPTAENFAHYFYTQLQKTLPVSRVTVYETPENCASYTKEENYDGKN